MTKSTKPKAPKKARGRRPGRKKIGVHIKVFQDDYDRLRDLCDQEDKTMSQAVRGMITEYLEQASS